MKHIAKLVLLALSPLSAVMAQTTGAPLNLALPNVHSPNWNIPLNANFTALNTAYGLLAPKNNPTFTGTVTFPITGSTQCLRVNSAGVVSGTGADCGAGGAVASVFGRAGAVIAVNGDYSFSLISGTVAPSQLPLATSSAFGAVKCDGTTIICTAGVISSVGGGGSSIGTAGQMQMVGSTAGSFAASAITDNGTVVTSTETINVTGANGLYTATSASGGGAGYEFFPAGEKVMALIAFSAGSGNAGVVGLLDPADNIWPWSVNQTDDICFDVPGGAGVITCAGAPAKLDHLGNLTVVSCTGCGGGGGGNTTSTTLTTNTVPKANGANSIINSGITDDGTTMTYTGSGSAHGFQIPEGTTVAGLAANDNLWADSTLHRWIQNPNNVGALIVPGLTAAITAGHLWVAAANGIDLADGGVVPTQTFPAAGIMVSTGSAFGTSLTAPTGTIVGTTDTQTLTGKTLDGVSPATMAFVDFTSSGQTQLNAKAPLASPSFTGVPLAPTATVGTNTTQIATTAFVLANATGSGTITASPKFQLPFYSATGTASILTGDSGIITDGAGNLTVTSVTTAPSGGLGGMFTLPEGTAVAAATGKDICYGDSTAHGILCSFNNGSFIPLVTTTATQTLTNKTLDGVTPATMAFVDFTSSGQTQLGTKAPIASPTFTGTVTIPNGGVLGTPTSITLTSATGLPISTGVSGLGTSMAAFLATPSSANLRATLTDESGTGAALFAGGNIGAATGTSLLVTGNIDGTAPLTVTTGTTATLGGTFKSGYTLNQEATAATAVAYTLPTAAAGLQYCVGNSWNGTAATTGVLTVNASATGQFIIFTDGTLSATGGNVTSGGAAADAACFVGVDATHWQQFTQRGTWTKH